MSSPNHQQGPAILVTGLSGNLGQHLAPLLKEHPLVGVDLYRPRVDHPRWSSASSTSPSRTLLPSYKFVGFLYRLFWWLGVSPVPPEAYPYFAGSYVMNTERLERLLGPRCAEIVRHTTEEAMRAIVEA